MKRVYLDYNATTPTDPQVLEAMLPYLREDYGNPSSVHGEGSRARKAIEEAREKVAHELVAHPEEMIFTSGGTESVNLAIKGVIARALREKGNQPLHLVTSQIEHSAVLQSVAALETAYPVSVTRIGVNREGKINPEEVKNALRENTALISIQFVNNEIGNQAPIEEIGKLARGGGIVFHTDAIQAVGKIRINLKNLPVDLLSFSGHKIYGPKGIGGLYIRKGIKLDPLIRGGFQEFEKRGGTENVPGIVGLGEAIGRVYQDLEETKERVGRLRNLLEERLADSLSDVSINGSKKTRIFNTLNVTFKGISGETLLVNLDREGLAVSSGSACASGSIEPSHVLLAMGLERAEAKGAIRFSLGRKTNEHDIHFALQKVQEVVKRLRP